MTLVVADAVTLDGILEEGRSRLRTWLATHPGEDEETRGAARGEIEEAVLPPISARTALIDLLTDDRVASAPVSGCDGASAIVCVRDAVLALLWKAMDDEERTIAA